MLKNLSSILGDEKSRIGSASDDRSFTADREPPTISMIERLHLTPPRAVCLPTEARVFMSDRPGRESLADYVRRVRAEKGLSLTDVQRQSARSGPAIAGTYVNRIENGQALNPSTDRLKALARGLHVPEEEVFARARGVPPKTGLEAREAELVSYFRELGPDEQRFLIVTTKALHRERRSSPRRKSA